MEDEARRYRFNPLEQRGLVAGLQPVQLVVVGGAGLVAVAALRSAPSGAGLLIAAAVLCAAFGAAFWRVAGASPAQWVPVVALWGWRRVTGPELHPAPLAGSALTVRSGTDGRPIAGMRPAGLDRSLWAPSQRALAGIRLLDAPTLPGEEDLGVVRDARLGSYGAVLRVRGRAFSLLEPAEKARRLELWGTALAATARDGSPISRLQWVERSVPGDSDGLLRHLERAGVDDGPGRAGYLDLIDGAGPVTQDHHAFLFVGVRAPRRSPSVRAFGGGVTGACGLLRRELRLLSGQLRSAEVVVDGALSGAELAGCLRAASDPGQAGRGAPAGPWPMAGADGWAAYRADDRWHVTYWVAEWPRLDVGPDFLGPLFLAGGVRRTAAVVLEPVPTAAAIREAESARTAEITDEQLRERAGFLTTARRLRQAEGVARREAELAEGHAAFRFSGYITVTAGDPVVLEQACAEVEQVARQSYLELRRLYGRQAEAFTWTLPLGRGLR